MNYILTKENKLKYIESKPYSLHSNLRHFLVGLPDGDNRVVLQPRGDNGYHMSLKDNKENYTCVSKEFVSLFLLKDIQKTHTVEASSSALGELLTSRGSDKYEEVMNLHGLLLNHLTKASDKADTLSPQNLAYFAMVSHKLARLACGYGDNIDNLLDIAGYSQLQAGDK